MIDALRAQIGNLAARIPLCYAVLFGSYAKGNYTVGSDVDILIVYKGSHRDDVYALAKRTLGIPRLEIHAYTEVEYEELRPTLRRMICDGLSYFLSVLGLPVRISELQTQDEIGDG